MQIMIFHTKEEKAFSDNLADGEDIVEPCCEDMAIAVLDVADVKRPRMLLPENVVEDR